MKAFIEALKKHIRTNEDNFLRQNEWCGDTESGFHTEIDFDMDALLAEIDSFAKSFDKQKEQT